MTQNVSVMRVLALLALSAQNIFAARSHAIDAKYTDDTNNFTILEVLDNGAVEGGGRRISVPRLRRNLVSNPIIIDREFKQSSSHAREHYELFALQIAVFANMLGRMARDDDRAATQQRRLYPNLDDGDVVPSSEVQNEFQDVMQPVPEQDAKQRPGSSFLQIEGNSLSAKSGLKNCQRRRQVTSRVSAVHRKHDADVERNEIEASSDTPFADDLNFEAALYGNDPRVKRLKKNSRSFLENGEMRDKICACEPISSQFCVKFSSNCTIRC